MIDGGAAPAPPEPEPAAPAVLPGAAASDPPVADGPAIGLADATIGFADLLGKPVRDRRGEEIGTVSDVTISLETGRIRALVYETGGGPLQAIGIGEPETARVAADAFAIDPIDGSVIVDEAGEGRGRGR